MKKLEPHLGLSSVIAISIATMLGSGIFVLPGLASASTGPSLWLAYLLAGVCILPATASKSELATAMPTSGGTYVYIERTFGPMTGTIAGLGLWLSLMLKSAFALVGFGAYLSVFTDISLQNISLAILILITLLNIFGVGKVSVILIFVVSICVLSLLGLIGTAIPSFKPDAFSSPFLPQGFNGLISATALVFISFTGVTKVAAIAEEVKSPEKNLPRGIFISLMAVTLLYCSVSYTLVQVVPMEEIHNSLRPIYLIGLKLWGEVGGAIVAIIAIVTTSSMGNAGLLAASRFPFAMSRDRLLPSLFGRLHPKHFTPIYSIIISALFMGLAIFLLDIGKIAKLASAFMLIIYMMENVAVIVLRESRVQWYRPTYRAPLYPWIQIFGTTTTLYLLFSMGFIVVPGLLSISIPGALLYFLYSRRRTVRKGVIGIRGKRQDLVANPVAQLETMDLSVDAKIMVVLFGKEQSPEMLIDMGVALQEQGNLEVAHITEIPEQTDLDDILEEPGELRSLRRRVAAMAMEKKKPILFDPVVSHDITQTIYRFSEQLHCQWLLMEWKGKTSGALTFHDPVGWLKEHLHCNLGIFRYKGVQYIRKILVLLNGDPNDGIVTQTADRLASVYNAEMTLMRFVPKNTKPEVRRQIKTELEHRSEMCSTHPRRGILAGEKIIPSVLEATVEYDLFIFGSSQYSPWRNVVGTADDIYMERAPCSVLTVQTYPQKRRESGSPDGAD